MKTFTFYTSRSTRLDVKATSPKAAWNKIKSISYFNDFEFTGAYGIYDKDGLMNTGQIDGRIEIKK